MAANSKGKKKATAAPLPLEGCRVAISGSFPGHTQASLLEHATRLGAETAKSIGPLVTHLIASQSDYNKTSTKVNLATESGAFIVSLEWMFMSEEDGVKKSESEFALDAIATATACVNATTTANSNDSQVSSTVPPPVKPLNKRQVSSDAAPEPKKTKLEEYNGKAPTIGKSQVARDWAVQVPIDEGCTLAGYGVHVDDDSLIWDAALNQTSSKLNSNKFYRIQVLVNGANNDCKAWTRWGRMNELGKSAVLGDGSLEDAKLIFQKKFKDKSGLTWDQRTENPKAGKYVFVEKNYDPESDHDDADDGKPGSSKPNRGERKPPPCTLEPAVQELMQLIFNQQYFAATMSAMNYDDEKMPLGKLSRASIMRGFQMLKDLSAIIEGSAAPGSMPVGDLSDLYYSLIPHIFGNRTARPPVINNLDMVKQEIELLETLADMRDAANIMKTEVDEVNRLHPLDRQFRGLGLEEMTTLDPQSTEYQLLETYLTTTRGATHSIKYEVEDIFRIERQGERDRFEESVFSGPPQDRRLLWHGSRATNFGGILSQGLRIAPPEAPVSGYMFDKGVYLADMSSKSAGYCYPYISGGTALLLLCEAELGKPMRELSNSDTEAKNNAKAAGCLSTFGMGRTGPSQWKEAECVHPSLKGVRMPATKHAPPGPTGVRSALLYNEYICYDVAQVRLRYLFRVKM